MNTPLNNRSMFITYSNVALELSEFMRYFCAAISNVGIAENIEVIVSDRQNESDLEYDYEQDDDDLMETGSMTLRILVTFTQIHLIVSYSSLISALTFNINQDTYIPSFDDDDIFSSVKYNEFYQKIVESDQNVLNNSSKYVVLNEGSINRNKLLSLRIDLENIRKSIDKKSFNDLLDIIKSYDLETCMTEHNTILFLRRMLTTKKLPRVMTSIIDHKSITFPYSSYDKNSAIHKIYEILQNYVNSRHKYSIGFIGDTNTGKTEAVRACCIQLAEEMTFHGRSMQVMYATDVEKIRAIESIDDDDILLIIDDFDIPSSYSRDNMLSLLQGNTVEHSIPARYENINIRTNVHKIFLHNSPLAKRMRTPYPEAFARIKEYLIHGKVYEVNCKIECI